MDVYPSPDQDDLHEAVTAALIAAIPSTSRGLPTTGGLLEGELGRHWHKVTSVVDDIVSELSEIDLVTVEGLQVDLFTQRGYQYTIKLERQQNPSGEAIDAVAIEVSCRGSIYGGIYTERLVVTRHGAIEGRRLVYSKDGVDLIEFTLESGEEQPETDDLRRLFRHWAEVVWVVPDVLSATA